ncbi:S8 family serine peptidase [Dactylosporangium sp. CA-052675]|uniref:S8 family serine peptidase n=1 Tax=Dactylosporangium sp. CA-052675 TaxID=3239927 RepID=UPI003D8D2C5B
MHRFRTVAVLGLTTALLTGLPAMSATAAPHDGGVKGANGRTITLVTGDRVTLSPNGDDVSVEPGPGRKGMTFEKVTASGHIRVVPADAGALLAANAVDSRLFDITQLMHDGYDRRDSLPLIVTGTATAMRATPGLTGLRDLPAVKATAVKQTRGKAADSWRTLTTSDGKHLRSGLGKIWLDGVLKPTLDVSVPQIGAPEAWAAGYTGTGTTVAVLDTGIDDTHPDLAGQVTEHVNFTEGYEPDGDFVGHGTHVASTVAGTGAASAGKYKGVAPGAKLLDGKVCVQGGCAESWIIAGMNWAASRAKIVNLSLGGMDTDGLDPIEQAVQTLSDQYGTLFVVAAGNAGGVTEGAISSPGTAPAALTVGAVNDTDALADFSRRGPGPDGSLKPEITAPGVDIMAARASQSQLPGTAYTELSGTSMATSHVTGSAAVLAQQHPDWSGQRLKAALMAAAQPNTAYSVYTQGAGRVDIGRASRQAVTSTTPGVSFGFRSWPHTNDTVTTRSVTYHNDGAQPVRLSLNLSGTPARMFTLSASSVTVPAGGDASATVTADTRVGPDGRFGGWLTATAGDVVVRTPVVVDKEVESYDVTLTHLDRSGGTPSFFDTTLSRRDGDTYQPGVWGPDPDGTVTLRVPKGHYTLTSLLFHSPDGPKGATTGGYSTLLAQPDVDVSRNLTLTLDARIGQPIAVSVPRKDAQQYDATLAAYTRRPHGTAGIAVLGSSFDGVYAAQLDPAQHDDGFISIVSGQWARADAAGSMWNSPYTYAVSFPVRGRMVTGFAKTVANDDLAKVRADFAQVGTNAAGSKRIRSGLTSWQVGSFGAYLGFDLPFSRTEYYTADPDVTFAGDFTEVSADTGEYRSSVGSADYISYRTGQQYNQKWNRPVFGPALASALTQGVTRTGDSLAAEIPLYADGDGRPGWSEISSTTAALSRDGKQYDLQLGDFGIWSAKLPADEGTYRLEFTAERDATVSTHTAVAWTFRSRHVDAGPAELPLWTVRLTPDTDQYTGVRANASHRLNVTAVPQSGATVGQLTELTVEVSFDDGRTWRAVSVASGCAQIRTPSGSGFVSLRATAADNAASTVTETVIRAYRFGRALR